VKDDQCDRQDVESTIVIDAVSGKKVALDARRAGPSIHDAER